MFSLFFYITPIFPIFPIFPLHPPYIPGVTKETGIPRSSSTYVHLLLGGASSSLLALLLALLALALLLLVCGTVMGGLDTSGEAIWAHVLAGVLLWKVRGAGQDSGGGEEEGGKEGEKATWVRWMRARSASEILGLPDIVLV